MSLLQRCIIQALIQIFLIMFNGLFSKNQKNKSLYVKLNYFKFVVCIDASPKVYDSVKGCVFTFHTGGTLISTRLFIKSIYVI